PRRPPTRRPPGPRSPPPPPRWPSGVYFIAACRAILVLAPGRFSIMNCWPSRSDSHCAISRACGSAHPIAKTVLYDEPGGELLSHVARWRALAESGDDVEIRGACASACTMILHDDYVLC